ncbi:GNAT family N-acetyltransferase [Sulfitobacter sp. JB4-11]|uniref:GNAT family N-acetyltransferase n=1 Tax=Sulfitobacter rhodophyticola TaxID=3238304 RepID=UPI003512C709
MSELPDNGAADIPLKISRASLDYLDRVVDLDARITGQPKPDYWQDIFERYGSRHVEERFFLVAEAPEDRDADILGFIVGEVRGWEFGSQPCGWIFAVSVHPDNRQKGVGEALFRSICDEFRKIDITKVRTMVQRENPLHMAFFRSEGMFAGPYIQFEMDLDE